MTYQSNPAMARVQCCSFKAEVMDRADAYQHLVEQLTQHNVSNHPMTPQHLEELTTFDDIPEWWRLRHMTR